MGIARALAANPKVLLCDEPTSALDSATTRQILDLIVDVRDRLGITVVIITHEPSVVREVCDAATLLDRGRIAESGTLTSIALNTESQLARALLPLPRTTTGPFETERTVFSSGTESEVAHALHAIATEPDARVSSGAIETIGGARVGRWAVTVNVELGGAVANRLREAGLHIEDGGR